ncbi:hypothetical protein [Pseudonocardia humida]|uniref:Uncharacterized protein n=1 Tax=Pseudonocardia humida TaxID=2800819 RepID=A0ABT1A6F5_9PSEU|nr:hypothetical protein [Pseudonocardia humida]MCO1658597.1 hypothetical protein [Pseudonocardia humida]
MPSRTAVMTRMNRLFTAASLAVVLVSVERFSFTTEVFLEPARFLRLHELVQMTVIIPITAAVLALMLHEVSRRFRALSLGPFLLFVVGAYFYATGNGVHELGSFTLQTHCDFDEPTGDLCAGLFINDFYTGNTMFFAGALLMNLAVLVVERRNPAEPMGRGALAVLVVNALVFALAVLAYAAFDRVVVGLVFAVVMAVVALGFLVPVRGRYRRFPFTTYTALTYVVGTIASLLVRLLSVV